MSVCPFCTLNLPSVKFLIANVLFVLLAGHCFGQSAPLNSLSTKDAILAAEQVIKTYHAGAKPAHKVVKVVYFHGKNMQPLPHWEERLNRTLYDVSRYYQEEFGKYGIKSNGVPFEKSGDKYVITVVEGDTLSKEYNTDSGMRIQDEIAKKTAGKIDLTKDHVLVFSGLCYKREDSTYVFHAPYWGTGSSRRGLCFVADCELLDSKLLTDTLQRMKFSEQAVALKECGVAEFNSWYIGGIAHEMGHMFGLPHDNGNPSELVADEISLMGQYGSRHFRGYLWGDQQSSVISAAGIMQLISHPVFTQSARSQNDLPEPNHETLHVENNDKGVSIKTTISTQRRPYACYTLLRTIDIIEYFNKSSIQLMGPGNELNIRFGKLPGGMYVLGIVFIYPNGAPRFDQQIFFVNSDGVAQILDQPMVTYVNINAFHNRLLKEEKTTETALKLKILETLVHPPLPADPRTATGKRLFLSDAKWETAQVGWQEPARNYYTRESERTFFLENQGKIYEKGLFAHANSVYAFNLGKKWHTFSALAACRDDLIEDIGPVRFTVWGDGKLLYTSPVLTTGQQTPVNVDIRNINILELKAESTGLNNGHCWSIWLNPVIER
jgi:hypothetical protein